METWINGLLNSNQAGALTLVAVFLLGMTGVLTCACNYALFAVVAGYSGSLKGEARDRTAISGGIAFMAGAILSMALMGALFGYAGKMMGEATGSYGKIISGLLCIFFGLLSMDFLPFKMPSPKFGNASSKQGLVPAIIFGLTVGGISTAFNSCCNPVFPVILAASFIKGSTLWGLILLTVFAMGYSLPLAVGFTGLRWGLGKLTNSVGKVSRYIPYAGGTLLVVMGFYFIITV